MSTDEINRAIAAAEQFDWQQVVLNGGPPCFHLYDDGFCGRSERWAGHGCTKKDVHQFVSFAAFLKTVAPKL